MNTEILKQAVRLAEKEGHLFVVTADALGVPHLAAAGKLRLLPDGLMAITAWFCPGTVENLQVNKNISLVAWDARRDVGYQMLGSAEKVEELHMLDGYVPGLDSKHPVPQVERKIIVKVDRIIDFKHAPHTDKVR